MKVGAIFTCETCGDPMPMPLELLRAMKNPATRSAARLRIKRGDPLHCESCQRIRGDDVKTRSF